MSRRGTHGEQEAIPESGWNECALWTRKQMSPCGMCACVGFLFVPPLRGTYVGAAVAYNSWPDMSQCESEQHTDKDAMCECGHFLKLERVQKEQQTNSNWSQCKKKTETSCKSFSFCPHFRCCRSLKKCLTQRIPGAKLVCAFLCDWMGRLFPKDTLLFSESECIMGEEWCQLKCWKLTFLF